MKSKRENIVNSPYTRVYIEITTWCTGMQIFQIRKSTTQLPSIDDCDDNTYIVGILKTTYSNVYNSVSTPVHIVDSLYSKINKLILDSHETRQPHITCC